MYMCPQGALTPLRDENGDEVLPPLLIVPETKFPDTAKLSFLSF